MDPMTLLKFLGVLWGLALAIVLVTALVDGQIP